MINTKKILAEPNIIDWRGDTIVIGGGVAGVCASIAAARLGCKVALIQDRAVLGGNSSSEIRVAISGAGSVHKNARETGIIDELLIEDRHRNHNQRVNGEINSIWDIILWEWVNREKNITLFLNTQAKHAVMEGPAKIKGVYVESEEKHLYLRGEVIIDASGDGQIAYSAGAEYRMGREGQNEFNESLTPATADNYTMGSSLLFKSKDVGHPVSFSPPEWANKYLTDKDLPFRDHTRITSGFWWIEYGGMLNIINDNEKIRDELLKILFGVWDHIKNHGEHGAANFALDWVGFVPGKRESRRLVGDYILKQQDIESATLFSDRIAYGGWPIDLHPPKGIQSKEHPTKFKSLSSLYSIPFRCLYSKNIDNLMMAGRNISATHIAFGSTRIQGTCAILGQAAGIASYLCKKHKINPREIHRDHISELQQLLLKNDCYIIELKNEDPDDVARNALITASSSLHGYDAQNVISGMSRSEGDNANIWISDPAFELPQYIELDFRKKKTINTIYLTFDTNLDNKLIEPGVIPECIRDYTIYYQNNNDWYELLKEKGNYHRHRTHKFTPITTQKIRVQVDATNGAKSARIYEVRIY